MNTPLRTYPDFHPPASSPRYSKVRFHDSHKFLTNIVRCRICKTLFLKRLLCPNEIIS